MGKILMGGWVMAMCGLIGAVAVSPPSMSTGPYSAGSVAGLFVTLVGVPVLAFIAEHFDV